MSEEQELKVAIERVRRAKVEPLGAIYLPGQPIDAEEMEYINMLVERDQRLIIDAHLARLDAEEKQAAGVECDA